MLIGRSQKYPGTRKMIFCLVLIFVCWSGEGLRQTIVKAAVVTVGYCVTVSVVAPVLRTIFFLNSEFSFGEKNVREKVAVAF